MRKSTNIDDSLEKYNSAFPCRSLCNIISDFLAASATVFPLCCVNHLLFGLPVVKMHIFLYLPKGSPIHGPSDRG